MSTRVHLCEPGWEAPLLDELRGALPQSRHEVTAPGWITSHVAELDEPKSPVLAFVAQALPNAEMISATSISQWVDATGPRVIEALASHETTWRLHIYAHAGEVPAGRLDLIREGILAHLKKKQKRLLRTLREDAAASFAEDEALVQIALRSPTLGVLSYCFPDERSRLRHCLSEFPGGWVEPAHDRRAPSRAFAKLAEVEMRMHRAVAKDETCVDLGASPGSWTWWALERGACVTAVDRSPMRDDLMRHPQLTFVRGDAFVFEPEVPVDWLLCDVIAFPERSIELLERWLSERWCRQFCVTFKFRGADEYVHLAAAKQMLLASGTAFQLRRLSSNKNEVTAFGSVSSPTSYSC